VFVRERSVRGSGAFVGAGGGAFAGAERSWERGRREGGRGSSGRTGAVEKCYEVGSDPAI